MQLDTDNALKAAQQLKKQVVTRSRALSHEIGETAAPLADEALAFGAAALAAAVSYGKSLGAVSAGKWAVGFARRNPVVLGLSVLGLAGATIYALSRRSPAA